MMFFEADQLADYPNEAKHPIPANKLRSDARGATAGCKNYKWAFESGPT